MSERLSLKTGSEKRQLLSQYHGFQDQTVTVIAIAAVSQTKNRAELLSQLPLMELGDVTSFY